MGESGEVPSLEDVQVPGSLPFDRSSRCDRPVEFEPNAGTRAWSRRFFAPGSPALAAGLHEDQKGYASRETPGRSASSGPGAMRGAAPTTPCEGLAACDHERAISADRRRRPLRSRRRRAINPAPAASMSACEGSGSGVAHSGCPAGRSSSLVRPVPSTFTT